MSQLDLLPMNALTVIAACRRLEARITAYAPELTREQVTRLYGELCFIDLLFDRWEPAIRSSAAYQTRAALPPLSPRGEPDDRLERARHWRSKKAPTPYTTVKPKVPVER